MKTTKLILGLSLIMLVSTFSMPAASIAEARAAVESHVEWTKYNSYSAGDLGDGKNFWGVYNTAEIRMHLDFVIPRNGQYQIVASYLLSEVDIKPGSGQKDVNQAVGITTCDYPSDMHDAYAIVAFREYDGSSYTTLFTIILDFPNLNGYANRITANPTYHGTTFTIEGWLYYPVGQTVNCF